MQQNFSFTPGLKTLAIAFNALASSASISTTHVLFAGISSYCPSLSCNPIRRTVLEQCATAALQQVRRIAYTQGTALRAVFPRVARRGSSLARAVPSTASCQVSQPLRGRGLRRGRHVDRTQAGGAGLVERGRGRAVRLHQRRHTPTAPGRCDPDDEDVDQAGAAGARRLLRHPADGLLGGLEPGLIGSRGWGRARSGSSPRRASPRASHRWRSPARRRSRP